MEELIQGYSDGIPVDELAGRFQLDQGTVQSTLGGTAYPDGPLGLGHIRPKRLPGSISRVSL